MDDQAPRKRNAGLEPAFSKTEMQTPSPCSAPLPGLGAGLNKAITRLPGSFVGPRDQLLGSGQQRWHRLTSEERPRGSTEVEDLR